MKNRALILMSLILICSAMIRIGFLVGPSFADAGNLPQSIDNGETSREDSGRIDEVISALRKRENWLNEREESINKKMAKLTLVEEEITRKLDELKVAEESLRNKIAFAETAAENDIVSLTNVYENMKPKDAAKIFEKMDGSLAAGFLSKLNPEVAGKILSHVDSDMAYSISVILAARNAEAPN